MAARTGAGCSTCHNLQSHTFEDRIHNLGTTHSALLGLRDQPIPFSELSSLLSTKHELPDSSQLLRQVEAAVTCLVTCICRSPTPTCLCASLSTRRSGSRGRETSFGELAEEKAEGPSSPEKAKAALWPRPLPGRAEAVPGAVGKAQDATEAARLTEKNPHQALWLRRPGVLPAQTPPLDFLEPLPGRAGETHQEDGRPPDQPPQAARTPGWAGRASLPKAPPQAPLGAPGAQRPVRSPSGVRASP
eukprot:bmy_22336T0